MNDFILLWPVILAPSIWILVTFVISRMGGWSLLARVYLLQANTLDGESWRFQSVHMRWGTNYNNCVKVGANALGLGLSVIWLLRIGHPPLLIPWSEITIHRVKRSRFFPSWIEFRFRSEPSIPLRVNNRLFSKILDSSDKYYPEFRRIFLFLDSYSASRKKNGVDPEEAKGMDYSR